MLFVTIAQVLNPVCLNRINPVNIFTVFDKYLEKIERNSYLNSLNNVLVFHLYLYFKDKAAT